MKKLNGTSDRQGGQQKHIKTVGGRPKYFCKSAERCRTLVWALFTAAVVFYIQRRVNTGDQINYGPVIFSVSQLTATQ